MFKSVLLLAALSVCSCSSIPKRSSIEKNVAYLKNGGKISKIVTELANNLIKKKKNTGIVVGVVTSSGSSIRTFGYTDRIKETPMREDTIFQIGSITKVFTSHLLVRQIKKGVFGLDDRVSKFYPMSFKPNNPAFKDYTFRQFAYHLTGFPIVHDTIEFKLNAISFLFTGKNIWSHCTKKFLLNYVSNLSISKERIDYYRYSSLGYTFMGWILGQSDQLQNFEKLLLREITIPLGLTDTVFDLDEEQEKRLAIGYSSEFPPIMFKGEIIKPWHLHPGARAGGGLYSSPRDMMRYLKVQMGKYKSSEYSEVFTTQKQLINTFKRAKADELSWLGGETSVDKTSGMGWHGQILKGLPNKIVYVKGTFSGYKSFIGFDEKRNYGVFVLQNNLNSSDYIGLYLLETFIKYRGE